jgi:hypothetical protein
LPSYLKVKRWISLGHHTDDAELHQVVVGLFGRIDDLADRVMDRGASRASREAALRALRAALRSVTPRGRPPKLVPEDVAFLWREIELLYGQFQALVKEVQAGVPLEEDTAQNVVAYIRFARGGGMDERARVKALGPDFLEATPFPGVAAEPLLDSLAKIKRLGDGIAAFATRVLILRFGVRRPTALGILRRMNQAASARATIQTRRRSQQQSK